MINGFGFCASVDGLNRYVYNSATDKAQKYDFVGNLLEENISVTDAVKVRLKPVHFIMMVDLLESCKARVVDVNGDISEFTFSTPLFKTYEMLNMLLGMNIRFKTQRMVKANGIDVAAFLLCVSESIDIISTMNKIPQKV